MLQTSPNRHFTASTALLGKSKKKEKHSSGGDAASTSTSTSRDSKSSSTSPQDPHDFTALEEDIAANLQTLQTKLAHLRTSTRLDPQRVEEIRVVLDKAGSQSLKLGDVAQVIPKGGRNMVVMIGDKDVCPLFPFLYGIEDIVADSVWAVAYQTRGRCNHEGRANVEALPNE
jgi:hypothetical protein